MNLSDVIDELNDMFPNEQSLEFLSNKIEEVDKRILEIDNDLSEIIRKNSFFGKNSDDIIERSINMISDIEEKFTLLENQSKNTQNVVSDVCGTIQSYDNAKSNISSSITCLKRLQMASEAVNDLEIMTEEMNYLECADRILVLTTLLEYFENFESNELLDDIRRRFENEKIELMTKIQDELKRKLFEPVIDTSIHASCKVVDAFGGTFRDDIIKWFCTEFLKPYEQQFKTTPLDEIDRRFNWLKQSIELFKQDYQKIFPASWRIPYQISINFCEITRIQIKNVINKRLTASDFASGFEQTAQMEKALADAFAQNIINEKGESEWVKAKEFIGSIGSSFASFVNLYIQSEQTFINNFIQNAKGKLINTSCIDKDYKILKSAIELVKYMKNSIEKCNGFNSEHALFDLFFVLKEEIVEYTKEIYTLKPSSLKTEPNVAVRCAIVNTTHYLCSIIDGLAKYIQKLVQRDQRPMVKVDDAEDILNDRLRDQLNDITNGFMDDIMGQGFELLSNTVWTNIKEENILFPRLLTEQMNTGLEWLKKSLSNENFNNIRTLFINSLISKFNMCAFNGKLANNTTIEKLQQTSEDLENAVVKGFNVQPESIQHKFIKEQFSSIKSSLRVLGCLSNTMVEMYLELKKQPNKDEFTTLVKMKGVSGSDYTRILEEYDRQIKQRSQK